MIKAVIFDCFGVLVEPSLEPFCDIYFPDDAKKRQRVKDLDKEASSGHISYGEFTTELARLAGISNNKAAEFLNNNPPNIALLDYIKADLKPHYKIGFLSNASDDWMNDLFTPEQQLLFDDVVLSFKYGIVKPDTAIFELAAKRLGVEPADCLFVDDVEVYCQGSKAAGMQALIFHDFNSFREQFQAYK
ncbi:MAG: HAD-IA family hydrolase [Candidatus Saccharimonadales bacterium]